MSQFYNVTLEEMTDFLRAEKGWKLNDSQHREVVFDYNIKSKPFLLVRVYSGILRDSRASRGCGQDAIRVCVVNLALDKGWIKASRVYRVQGWQKNLQARIMDVITKAKERIDNPSKNQ